jgi:uncharacterized peroxidase-related enzyme
MDGRRYELVTIAAAKELRSSYCMLAHGSVLLRDHFSHQQLEAILEAAESAPLNDTEKAIMQFAAKVARDASSITASDVETLRRRGLSDAEIFDVVSAAAVRCFFSKTLDALGVQPDTTYNDIEPRLRARLAIGRSIEGQ